MLLYDGMKKAASFIRDAAFCVRLFPVQEIQGELHIDGGAEGKHILVHVEGVGVVGRGDALFLIAAAEEAVQAGVPSM